MKIELVRRYKGDNCVIGKFKVFDDNSQELLSCFALEGSKEQIEKDIDLRVLEGVYNLKRHTGSGFNEKGRKVVGGVKVLSDDDYVLNLFNDIYPFERHILIHWGNNDGHTEGCLLLGITKSNDNNSIGNSRLACKKFYDLMKNVDLSQVKLIIKNEFA